MREPLESPTVPFPPYRETYDTPALQGGTYLSYRSEIDQAGAAPQSMPTVTEEKHVLHPSTQRTPDHTKSKIPQSTSIPHPSNTGPSKAPNLPARPNQSSSSRVHPDETYAEALESPAPSGSGVNNGKTRTLIQPVIDTKVIHEKIPIVVTQEEKDRMIRNGEIKSTQHGTSNGLPQGMRQRSHNQNTEHQRGSENVQRDEANSSILQDIETKGRNALDMTEAKMSGALSSAQTTARETMDSMSSHIRRLSSERSTSSTSMPKSNGHPDPTSSIYSLADSREASMNTGNTMRSTMSGVDVITPNDLRSEPSDGLRGAVDDLRSSRNRPWSEQPLFLAVCWMSIVAGIYYGWTHSAVDE